MILGVVSENMNYLGSKIRVQYSLYIGDQKDVIHTISLRVPKNFTAHKVMEMAEAEDPKYKYFYFKILYCLFPFMCYSIIVYLCYFCLFLNMLMKIRVKSENSSLS